MPCLCEFASDAEYEINENKITINGQNNHSFVLSDACAVTETSSAVVSLSVLLGVSTLRGSTACTVEPPNKGHFGIGASVLYSEVVLWWEVQHIVLFMVT